MRKAAQILFAALFLSLAFSFFQTKVYAQTTGPSPSPLVTNSATAVNNYLAPDTDPNVPQNHHTYTQIVLIDVMSAFMCQLTGIDPTNPKQPCLGIDPATGKIGMSPEQNTQQFGEAHGQPQIGGTLGLVSQYISYLYIQPVSTSQYINYLASNFGIVKHAYAAAPGDQCNNTFGYGFCGLAPIFELWTGMRDFAYFLLTIVCILIGGGVMIRFRVDPRTVMTLQNQIPRVFVSIILITFSYAFAGIMVDFMWTVTYAGINFISSASNSEVAVSCGPTVIKPINQAAEQTLIDQPVSFTDMVYNGESVQNRAKECSGIVHSGIFHVAQGVSVAFGDLITQVVANLLGLNLQSGCDLNPLNFHPAGCITGFFLWLTEQIVKLIIIVAILIALFRLWYQLIKCYLTFIIFVIMGPLWIVMGLIPGRPLGFEKWLRIIFANLAVFPLVAFIIVFGRVLVDAIPANANPQNVFIPPLVGNPNVATFTAFMGFGAIMMAPTIPDLIKERMKATGQGKYGQSLAAGIGFAAGAVTNPGRKVWDNLNRTNSMTGAAEGSLAIMKQRAWQKTPYFGRRAIAKKNAAHAMLGGNNYKQAYKGQMNHLKGIREEEREQRQENPGRTRRLWNRVRGQNPSRGSSGSGSGTQGSGPSASRAATGTPQRTFDFTMSDAYAQKFGTENEETGQPSAPSSTGDTQKQKTPLRTKLREAMYGQGTIPNKDIRTSSEARGGILRRFFGRGQSSENAGRGKIPEHVFKRTQSSNNKDKK